MLVYQTYSYNLHAKISHTFLSSPEFQQNQKIISLVTAIYASVNPRNFLLL